MELANRLGADWRAGDSVMTWIRRHEGATEELSGLVRDGWSWTDLGKALGLAGIRYQTGTVMSGDLLRRKAGKARADARKREAEVLRRRSESAAVKAQSAPAMSAGAWPRLEQNPGAADRVPIARERAAAEYEPEFTLAKLAAANGGDDNAAVALPAKKHASTAQPPVDVDAIIARLTGQHP